VTAAGVAERALDATFAEVAERGLRALTVEAVAVRAGTSRATLYRHFPGGRDELIDQTIRREVRRFFDGVLAAAPPPPPDGDLVDHVVGLVRAAHRELGAHDVLQRLLLDEADALVPSLSTVHPLVGGRLTDHLARVLEAAVAAGAVDPGVRVDAAGDHCARLVLSYVGSPGRWDLEDRAAVERLVRTQILAGVATDG
jgi:AcrR family transcriptional regulator